MTSPTPRLFKQVKRASQSGQAIVLIGLLILVLFGMLGLAIDSGRAYVDRRDQQAAVDAAALAAGDWYENYSDLYGSTLPNAKLLYQTDLHLYGGPSSDTDVTTFINGALQQDTDTITYPGGYTLVIVATDTQFNGYQFSFTSTHNLPLAFMQIFGGSPQVTIIATATSIVGNQRQTPAVLTLSTGRCSLNLNGSATLTLLGDAYSNGTACVDASLQEAGNCYGAAGSTCGSAAYYCYNATPGFVPYPPPCNPGDVQGQAVVPAPTLPDPLYISPSLSYYTALGVQSTFGYSRGTYNEMYPGVYGFFHPSGGFGCAFLDPGIYVWSGGYKDDANNSLISNELKPPDEQAYNSPGTTAGANIPFWQQNGVTCQGHFALSVVNGIGGGQGIKHNGGGGNWGVELTSVRWDQFYDPTIAPNPCFTSPGCRRESAPSACQQVSTTDTNNAGIAVKITQNSPGAQYYNIYVNPNGCDGNQDNFAFVGNFIAPGFADGGGPPATPVGPYPSGTGVLLTGGRNGYSCSQPSVSLCGFQYTNLQVTAQCFAQTRSANCQTPDNELAPQCFSSCSPPPAISQENAAFALEYPPYTGGDVANENYCQLSPNPGNPNSPCATAKITPGAVQFYLPNGACLDQESAGATYVFAGEQYNWISIYEPAANTCSNSMNGGTSTQYIGTIYTPGAGWTINGGNRAPLAGQVICYTATVSGNGQVGVDFNPNYSPAPPAARLIN